MYQFKWLAVIFYDGVNSICVWMKTLPNVDAIIFFVSEDIEFLRQ